MVWLQRENEAMLHTQRAHCLYPNKSASDRCGDTQRCGIVHVEGTFLACVTYVDQCTLCFWGTMPHVCFNPSGQVSLNDGAVSRGPLPITQLLVAIELVFCKS